MKQLITGYRHSFRRNMEWIVAIAALSMLFVMLTACRRAPLMPADLENQGGQAFLLSERTVRGPWRAVVRESSMEGIVEGQVILVHCVRYQELDESTERLGDRLVSMVFELPSGAMTFVFQVVPSGEFSVFWHGGLPISDISGRNRSSLVGNGSFQIDESMGQATRFKTLLYLGKNNADPVLGTGSLNLAVTKENIEEKHVLEYTRSQMENIFGLLTLLSQPSLFSDGTLPGTIDDLKEYAGLAQGTYVTVWDAHCQDEFVYRAPVMKGASGELQRESVGGDELGGGGSPEYVPGLILYNRCPLILSTGRSGRIVIIWPNGVREVAESEFSSLLASVPKKGDSSSDDRHR